MDGITDAERREKRDKAMAKNKHATFNAKNRYRDYVSLAFVDSTGAVVHQGVRIKMLTPPEYAVRFIIEPLEEPGK